MPQVATQDVLAELGRIDPPAAGRLDAEALLKQTLQDLQAGGRTGFQVTDFITQTRFCSGATTKELTASTGAVK